MTKPFEVPGAAAAAGEKGGARRRELAELSKTDPEGYMRSRFQTERSQLANRLLDAAYGRGPFGDTIVRQSTCSNCGEGYEESFDLPGLAPDKQLAALTKAMEYAFGKPQAGRATGSAPPQEDTPPSGGLNIT